MGIAFWLPTSGGNGTMTIDKFQACRLTTRHRFATLDSS